MLAAALTVAGCSASTDTGAKGFVDGSGITQLKPSERRDLGPVTGATLENKTLTLEHFKNRVVVVNVWASWCGPCREEAPLLASVAQKFKSRDVVFVGLNTRDAGPSQALAFQQRYKISYPSLYDPSGKALLAFHGTLPPSAIPATVVIDRAGRVAASILGPVPTEQTLVDVVADVRRSGR